VAGWSKRNDSEGEFLSRVLPKRDGRLIQIVDAALADATKRSGEWLVCRPGCTQCCHGVFAISQLDALRLRTGIERLDRDDPARATHVRRRASETVSRIGADFPGDRRTGILAESTEAQAAFDEFANDEPCPALDPATGLCDLYEWRPMTCRVFGPPVRVEGGFSVCELCFSGATAAEIAACEMVPDPERIEDALTEQAEIAVGVRGRTIVALALLSC
jgi:Fe-S-cluster containining protein